MNDTSSSITKLKAAIDAIPSGSTTRFAPSPTGYLHIGHIASALFVWIIGKKTQSKIIFRMEDHDQGRYRPEYDLSITEDLMKLGFTPDEGIDIPSKASNYHQSKRTKRYESILENLIASNQAYACKCSRREIQSTMETTHGKEMLYLGTCRNKGIDPEGKNIGIRLRLSDDPKSVNDLWLGKMIQTPSKQCGDILLRDRGGLWTYQFCCVVDDHDQGIDLIVRGQDLAHCVGRQIQLAQILGFKPCRFFLHHPLITDQSGQKLSKRFLSTSIRQMMDQGHTPEAIIGRASYLVGIKHDDKPISLNDLIESF